MKTYKNIAEEPLLRIEHDQDPESPRTWSNLGFFLTKERGNNSPDGTENELYKIMVDAEELAEDSEEHVKIIKGIARDKGIEVVAIYPINKYEHSGVSYSVGSKRGFDYSNCGFYIITKESAKEVGVEREDYLKVIESELETYNKWANGEVYQFVLFDKNGEVEDSCSGFYEIEAIRDHLSKSWENEDLEDYLIN